jgi:ABC-2 type transport system permease protein
MKRLWHIYRVLLRTKLLIQFQYRAALVIWMLDMVLNPLIYLVVWSTVARSNGGSLDGYTPGAFAAYFIVLLLVNHLTDNWVYYEFQARIREGQLSSLLLRPLHPIHADLATNLTNKFFMLIVVIPAMLAMTLLFQPSAHITLWSVLAFLPALVMAIALRFIVEWTLGLAAFWTTQMNAVIQIYYIAQLFLSGQVAPLSVFPPVIQWLAWVSPFQWMIAFPVQLLLGQLPANTLLPGFATQFVWLWLSLGILSLLWKRGLRQYSAVGA